MSSLSPSPTDSVSLYMNLATVAALQTYSTEYSFQAYVCITCGRQTIFSTSTFSQEDTPNYVVNKEFSVLGWLLTSYI